MKLGLGILIGIEISPTSGKLQVPLRKKNQLAQSKVKLMMIFTYDHKEVTKTDRVPCGRSVIGMYYCDFIQKIRMKIHKN